MDPLLHLSLALALGALFAASAAHQLLAWRQWPGVIRNYRLVPDVLSQAVAVVIPVAEILAAGALAWAPSRAAGAAGGALLLVLFAGAMAINIQRGRTDVECGCFGPTRVAPIASWMVWRNLVLLAFALALLRAPLARELSALEIAAACAWVATLALLYPALEVAFRSRLKWHGSTGVSGRQEASAGGR